MGTWVVLLAALFSYSQSRFPGEAEKTAILAAAKAGLAAHYDFLNARDAALSAPAGSAERRRAAAQAIQFERMRADHFQEAIRRTLDVYGIHPDIGEGVVMNGPFAKNRVVTKWKPQFFPDEITTRQVWDGEKNRYLHFASTPYETGGTWADGAVMVRLWAFQESAAKNSPAVLAYILHHESVHFSKLLSTGWTTMENDEEEAYSRSLEVADKFGLTGLQIQSIQKRRRAFSLKKWISLLPFFPGLHDVFPDEEKEREFEDKYRAQEAAAAPFEEAKREAESVRVVSRNYSQPVLVRPDILAPMELFDSRRAAAQLVNLAKKACANPADLRTSDLAAINRWFPDERSSLSISDWMGLSGCSYDLYIWIREKNSMAKGYQLHAGEIALAAGKFRLDNMPPTAVETPVIPATGVPGSDSRNERDCWIENDVMGCRR